MQWGSACSICSASIVSALLCAVCAAWHHQCGVCSVSVQADMAPVYAACNGMAPVCAHCIVCNRLAWQQFVQWHHQSAATWHGSSVCNSVCSAGWQQCAHSVCAVVCATWHGSSVYDSVCSAGWQQCAHSVCRLAWQQCVGTWVTRPVLSCHNN